MIPESGLILIDKPYGWTSFDVVNKTRQIIRSILGHKVKTGHTGTLDPLATGLLVLCYGIMTKNIEELTGLDKEYVSTLEFGATTASFDKEQPIDNHYEFAQITEDMVREAMKKFSGEIVQVPPSYSAKWVNGRRAYEYARKGLVPEMEERRAIVHEIELVDFSLPKITFRIMCGKGFYVRSFARDIGLELKSGAYISELRRMKIGSFSIENAVTIDKVQDYLLKDE